MFYIYNEWCGAIRVFVVGLSVEVSSAVHHLPVSVHDNLLTFPPPQRTTFTNTFWMELLILFSSSFYTDHRLKTAAEASIANYSAIFKSTGGTTVFYFYRLLSIIHANVSRSKCADWHFMPVLSDSALHHRVSHTTQSNVVSYNSECNKLYTVLIYQSPFTGC